MILEHLLVRPHLLEAGLDAKSMRIYERAGTLATDDCPFVFESAEGVAEGGSAHAEIGREFGLGRDSPIVEVTIDDELLEVLAYPFGEGGAACDQLRHLG